MHRRKPISRMQTTAKSTGQRTRSLPVVQADYWQNEKRPRFEIMRNIKLTAATMFDSTNRTARDLDIVVNIVKKWPHAIMDSELELLKKAHNDAIDSLETVDDCGEEYAKVYKEMAKHPEELQQAQASVRPRLAMIKKCRESDKDDRPAKDQEWCLYTKDGSRLLGRHPTENSARRQEMAIQIHKSSAGRRAAFAGVRRRATTIYGIKRFKSESDLLHEMERWGDPENVQTGKVFWHDGEKRYLLVPGDVSEQELAEGLVKDKGDVHRVEKQLEYVTLGELKKMAKGVDVEFYKVDNVYKRREWRQHYKRPSHASASARPVRAFQYRGATYVLASLPPEGEKMEKNLKDADLSGRDLSGEDLRGADLEGANLRGADLQRADLRAANLEGAYLRGANLRGANLRDAWLPGADLEGANLRGADLQRADLRAANLEDASLEDASLRDANLEGADLQRANLQRANLRNANLRYAAFQGANLRGADLQRADLQNAWLHEAYLQDAKLKGAYLQDAKLKGAQLQGADLEGADLQDADLRDADLQDAKLKGANLEGANLEGTILEDEEEDEDEHRAMIRYRGAVYVRRS